MKKISLYDLLSKTPASDKDLRVHLLKQVLNYKTSMIRIPYNVSLELTPICNFNCPMCYIRMSKREFAKKGHILLHFNDWKFYIDGLCEAGTENFTLTGGECMTHPDFIKIYDYIYDLKKTVSLITNGSCLTNEILDLFIKKPPSIVFLTLYGSSAEVYQRFCKNGNAFQKVINCIDKLVSHKINVKLLSTICKENEDEVEKISDLAKRWELSVNFAGDLVSYGQFGGEKLKENQINIFQRKVKDYQLLNHNSTEQDFLKNYRFPQIDETQIHDKGIDCVATKNACAVSWYGTMKPCVTFEPITLDPRTDGGVKECWEKLVEWGDNVPQIKECQTCIFKNECMPCLARHYYDTHEFGVMSTKRCFKIQHPEEAAKLQAEYDRRQALKKAEESAQ